MCKLARQSQIASPPPLFEKKLLLVFPHEPRECLCALTNARSNGSVETAGSRPTFPTQERMKKIETAESPTRTTDRNLIRQAVSQGSASRPTWNNRQ